MRRNNPKPATNNQKTATERTGRWLAFITCLLFGVFILHSGYCYPATHIIRVRIEEGKERLQLSVRSTYKVEDLNSGLVLYRGRRLRKRGVTPTNSGIKIGKRDFKVYGIRVIPKRDGALYLGDKRLRGTLDIIRTKDMKLLVVNNLDIEKYLYGVLHRELPHYWPLETLKAQAIVARTFALYRKKLSRNKEYDVTSDIYSQVYGGHSSERWRTTRAVDSTRGKVLTYKGKLFPAYYHSICGGHTEDAESVFEIRLEPLRGRRCTYCKGARGMNWKAIYSYRQIEERLNKYGIEVKGMNYIIEGKRSRSGRLDTIRIKDRKGVREIKGYKFRLALGPNAIRSTNFTIDITPRGVIFRGKGWGHGVGMCQWGAFGLAKRRFSYKQILAYYYPGAEIRNIYEIVRI